MVLANNDSYVSNHVRCYGLHSAMSAPTDGRERRQQTGLAILNQYGGIWTDELFETPEAALAYLKSYWKDQKDLSGYRLVQAVKTIEVYRPQGDPVIVPLPV